MYVIPDGPLTPLYFISSRHCWNVEVSFEVLNLSDAGYKMKKIGCLIWLMR